MNKDKQIEDMANVLDACPNIAESIGCDKHEGSMRISEYLTQKSYRKFSDVAREIFEEIEKIIDKHYNKHIFDSDLEDTEIEAVMDFSGDISYDIDELKKKYTEEVK